MAPSCSFNTRNTSTYELVKSWHEGEYNLGCTNLHTTWNDMNAVVDYCEKREDCTRIICCPPESDCSLSYPGRCNALNCEVGEVTYTTAYHGWNHWDRIRGSKPDGVGNPPVNGWLHMVATYDYDKSTHTMWVNGEQYVNFHVQTNHQPNEVRLGAPDPALVTLFSK